LGATKVTIRRGPLTGTLSLICYLNHFNIAFPASLRSCFRNRLYSLSVLLKRTNIFCSFFTNLLNCRIYETKSPTHFSLFFFHFPFLEPFYIFIRRSKLFFSRTRRLLNSQNSLLLGKLELLIGCVVILEVDADCVSY